jgi:hypothetical protein
MASCVPLLQGILNDSECGGLTMSGFDLDPWVKSAEYKPPRSAMGRNVDGAGPGLVSI